MPNLTGSIWCPVFLQGLLNSSKFFQYRLALPYSLGNQKQQGMLKKARPARPQVFWRAERTDEYVSTTKD